MSQRKEHQVRNLERRLDAVERVLDVRWSQAEKAAQMDAAAERNMERRRAHRAEQLARRWQILTGAALVISIAVEIAAICCINAKAFRETQNAEPISMADSGRLPGDDIPAAEPAMRYDGETSLIAQSRVIHDCTITHYDACVQCCGKAPDHPAYGITASGTRATPYRTVAVDPSVIPLGADVLVDYGDGAGLRRYRAEDTGGAIKGNHIDLCVGSHAEALQLGRRTATVYWVAQEE